MYYYLEANYATDNAELNSKRKWFTGKKWTLDDGNSLESTVEIKSWRTYKGAEKAAIKQIKENPQYIVKIKEV